MQTWGDEVAVWPVASREVLADATIFQLGSDTVAAPDGDRLVRAYLVHPGAVAVVALDEDENVVVLRQYRHPVGMRMIEIPAGLLDVQGEDWLLAAQRELAEEAQLRADDWRVLTDLCCSPGSTQESIRVYLARGLHPAPRPDGFVVAEEELDMEVTRAPLKDLLDAVLAGECSNPTLVVGVLSLWAARDRLDTLRTPDAPWRARQARTAFAEALDGCEADAHDAR